MENEFTKKIAELYNSASAVIEAETKKLLGRIDLESQKTKIRSEIGHNSRELSRTYEKLGREFFQAKNAGKEFKDSNQTFELIQAKEKLISLLHEKLDLLEKDGQEKPAENEEN